MFRQRFKLFVQALLCTIAGLLLLSGLFSTVQRVGTALGAPLFQVNNPNPVPTVMNYQGTLRDPEGKPLTGAFKMTFRIYHDVTAPASAAVWAEVHEGVTVRDGNFNALLGNNIPLPMALFKTADAFIGVQVDPYDEMVPRQRFATVPYAAHADFAHRLLAPGGQGQDALFFSPSGQLVARQALTMTYNNQTLTLGTDGINSSSAFAINGSSKQNVGIGTTNPQANLHVSGNKVLLQNGGRTVQMDAAGDWGGIQSNGNIGLQGNNYVQITTGAGGGEGELLINPTNPAKRVGIGMYGPTTTLDVNGTANVRGRLSVNQAAPVRIIRFENVGNDANFDTGLSELEYSCVAAGWSATWRDNEINGVATPGVNMVWSYAKLSTWWLRVSFHSTSDSEDPDVDLLCFRNEIVTWEGGAADLNDPN